MTPRWARAGLVMLAGTATSLGLAVLGPGVLGPWLPWVLAAAEAVTVVAAVELALEAQSWLGWGNS